MTPHAHTTAATVLALALSACGGGARSAEHPTVPSDMHPSASQEGQASQEGKASGEARSEQPTITAPIEYGADPSLSVYVQGPVPIHGAADIDASAGAYRTLVTVNNTGDLPAQIDQARVWFEVWQGNHRLPCAQERFFPHPPTLEPGESHTFEVTAGCALPEHGEYEVRVYVAFGAEGGDVNVQRYYAGRYFVTR